MGDTLTPGGRKRKLTWEDAIDIDLNEEEEVEVPHDFTGDPDEYVQDYLQKRRRLAAEARLAATIVSLDMSPNEFVFRDVANPHAIALREMKAADMFAAAVDAPPADETSSVSGDFFSTLRRRQVEWNL